MPHISEVFSTLNIAMTLLSICVCVFLLAFFFGTDLFSCHKIRFYLTQNSFFCY